MPITSGVGPATAGIEADGAPATATLNGTTAGRSLVAMLHWSPDTATLTSVTVSGESNMTLLNTYTDGVMGQRTALAYLGNITAGGNKTIVATWSASFLGRAEIWVKEYVGGDTASWFDVEAGAAGIGLNGQVSLTTTVAGCLVLGDVGANVDDAAWTPNAGYTVVELLNVKVWTSGVEDLDAEAAGVKTPGFNFGSNAGWVIAAAAFKPAELVAAGAWLKLSKAVPWKRGPP